MGAAWCRERIEQAQNSKSPVDRIITRCSNAINAKTIYSKPNQSKPANDIVFKQIRYATSPPVPVHRVPPPRSHHTKDWVPGKPGEWQDVPLKVPGSEEPKTPVPPPRKRKKRKTNSLDVLNSQLDMIYESNHNLRRYNEHSQPLFGDPLPVDTASSSSPERTSPTKSIGSENKRKTRAKKIMESKTKYIKKDTTQPLSIANNRNGKASKDEWSTPKLVKNISTISLPSYHELSKHRKDSLLDCKSKHDVPKRNISTVSLPGETVLTAISGITMNRLEAYMRRCKSFGSLKPQQLLEKLEEITNKQESESSDSWSGLDDWDLGIIEYCDAEASEPPLVPKSRITSKQTLRLFELGPPSVLPDAESFPPSPPVLRRELSMSDNTFDKPHPTHDWFSSPAITVVPTLKTPPPTPEEGDLGKEEEEEFEAEQLVEDDPHSTLLKILSKYRNVEVEDEPAPTPPRRKSREDRRRQSYHISNIEVPKIPHMARSFSLDTTLDEDHSNMTKLWHNMSFSSSQHSRSQALTDFLGFDNPPEQSNSPKLSLVEINLNSSLFPVIGLQTGDKGAPSASPGEIEEDRKTPPPPPLPSSPPPIAAHPSTDLSAT